jgi:hypothetical protein
MASVVLSVATAKEVVRIFFETASRYGLPQSVLSANGAIYTAAYGNTSSCVTPSVDWRPTTALLWVT